MHAASALLSGLPLEGVWYDRTKEYLVKIKGKKTDPDRFAEPETLALAPLPCWSHLSPEAYRTRIAKLIDQIEANAAAQGEAAGRKPLGAEAILRQDVLWVEDARQLARLMTYFNSKLAREIGRLTGWRQKVWSRRYQAIVISQEEEAQVERLTYVLSNGVKEGLVARVLDWPGVHAAPALLSGLPLEGVWYDRTKEYLSKLIKGKKTAPDRFAEPETLTLAPLPCWKHLSPEDYRARIKDLVQQIDADAAAQREASGHKPLGAEAILRQDPRTEPNRTKKSPAPRFHAVRKWVRQELYQTYTLFVQAYREAAELLKAGNRTAVFPRGCFPPPLPFVT